MDKPYFVMLYNQKRTTFIPLVDEDGELIMFNFPSEAGEAADNTVFGEHFGYEIFKAGDGIL